MFNAYCVKSIHLNIVLRMEFNLKKKLNMKSI